MSRHGFRTSLFRLGALALTALLLPGVAAAQPSGWSLGVGMGLTRFDANQRGIAREFIELQPGFDVDDSGTSFRIMGSYMFDPVLAIDMDFVALGDVIAEDGNGRNKLFSVEALVTAVRLRHRFNDKLIGFARLGASIWGMSGSGGPGTDTVDDGVNATLGAGLDIDIHDGFGRALRLEWGHYEFNGVLLDTADTFTANLVFNY